MTCGGGTTNCTWQLSDLEPEKVVQIQPQDRAVQSAESAPPDTECRL